MTRENEIEQALARTVRGSLDRFQRTAEELQQAVNDLVAACSSARVANTLPAMMRAQMSAASLAASLEALSRLVTSNLPTTYLAPTLASPVGGERAGWESGETFAEPQAPAAAGAAPVAAPAAEPFSAPVSVPSTVAQPQAPAELVATADTMAAQQLAESAATPLEAESAAALAAESAAAPEAPPVEMPAESSAAPPPLESLPEVAPETASEPAAETVASLPASELLLVQDSVLNQAEEDLAGAVAFTDFAAALEGAGLSGELSERLSGELREGLSEEAFPETPGASGFSIAGLPVEVQELHRRANRVAKVSMQDIKLLRPEDVRLGRQHRDLCYRLREDLERAHKEYDRRFQTILDHPVDYFYDWLVEILAEGDPQLLGEYPYPSPALRR